jgi:hypothetical protein
MAFRMYYVDDSGAPSTGWVVYSWVEVDTDDWVPVAEEWLRFRKSLLARYQIPVDFEIHSTKFLMGRGDPSCGGERHRTMRDRPAIFCQALNAIRAMPSVDFGTVYRRTADRRGDYTSVAREVYGELVIGLNARLELADDRGLIIIDGNGTDTGYRPAHRCLDSRERHIIEDPFFHAAHANAMLQIADIVAHTAYLSLARNPDREFAWGWYREHLSDTDPREV